MGWLDEGGGWAGGILRQIGPYIGGAIEGLLPGQKQKGRPPVAAGPTMAELANPFSDYYTNPPWLGEAVPPPSYQVSSPVLTVTPVPPMRTTEVGPVPTYTPPATTMRTTEGGGMGFENPFGISSLPVPYPGPSLPVEGGGFPWGAAIDIGIDVWEAWRSRKQSPPGPKMAPPMPQLPPGPQLPAPRWPGGPQVPAPYTAGPPYADLPAYGATTTAGACPTMFRPAQATRVQCA